MTSIIGLSNLEALDGLFLAENTQLNSLNGLENLTVLNGGLNFYNTKLTDLDALKNITSMGSLELNRNSQLTNLDGLSNVTVINGRVRIVYHDVLSDFCGLKPLMAAGFSDEYLVNDNTFNPTQQDIIDGNCKQ